MDNYAAHKHAEVKKWLAANPRIHVHFTPTHASWMNMVEIFFGIAERQAIRRGTFRSVRELTTTIRRFIDHLQQDLPAVCLDQDRGPDPHESQASNHFRNATLGPVAGPVVSVSHRILSTWSRRLLPRSSEPR